MSVVALILAAGEPKQMEHFQPMLKLGGKTLVARQIETFREAGVEEILIVTGYHAGLLERHLQSAGVRFVRNREYVATEMMDSVKCGLQALPEDCERVLITPADVPYLHAETIRKLLLSDRAVAIPSYQGAAGHPAMVKRACFPSLISYAGERGLRGALAQWKDETEFVPTDENGMLTDINTEAEYQRQQRKEKPRVHPEVTAAVALRIGELMFDERCVRLLECIESEQSLQKGAEKAGISYSNAWKLLNLMEQELGRRLVERRLGGTTGGGSSLTEQGREWIGRFRRVERRMKEDAIRIQTEEFD